MQDRVWQRRCYQHILAHSEISREWTDLFTHSVILQSYYQVAGGVNYAINQGQILQAFALHVRSTGKISVPPNNLFKPLGKHFCNNWNSTWKRCRNAWQVKSAEARRVKKKDELRVPQKISLKPEVWENWGCDWQPSAVPTHEAWDGRWMVQFPK